MLYVWINRKFGKLNVHSHIEFLSSLYRGWAKSFLWNVNSKVEKSMHSMSFFVANSVFGCTHIQAYLHALCSHRTFLETVTMRYVCIKMGRREKVSFYAIFGIWWFFLNHGDVFPINNKEYLVTSILTGLQRKKLMLISCGKTL